MTFGAGRTIIGAIGATIVCLLGAALAGGQTGAQEKPLMAEDVYKNIQVLKGIPENQFLATMGFFSASLGWSCENCHNSESTWEAYAQDTPNKQTARKMIQMMSALNQSFFGGRRVVTCWSCHRGGERPPVTPDLAQMYSTTPTLEEPDEISEQAPDAPPADQVLDKYIQAIGGMQKLASLTSFVAKGTYQGFSSMDKGPIDVFAKAPNQRTTVVHTDGGDWTTTFDGRGGWVAEPGRPVPLLALTGLFLDAVKVDADLSFPARIKQALTDWRVGLPSTIDNRRVQVVQGISAGKSPVKLYFDSMSGLLVRLVRYTDSPVGRNPTQIDYSDYRDVAGIKMPFHYLVTWTDGRSNIQFTEVRPNVAVDAAKFAKPAPPSPPKSAAR